MDKRVNNYIELYSERNNKIKEEINKALKKELENNNFE